MRTRPDDRWQTGNLPVRRFSAAMALVLLGSLVLHAIIVGTAFFGETRPIAPPQEISVEVVQEPPKDPPKPQPTAKLPGKDAPGVDGAPKAEAPKAEPPKPEAKVEPPKPEPPKPEPAKPEPKAEQPKPEPPKPQALKPEPPKPAPVKPEPPKAAEAAKAEPDAASKRIETMENELAALKAERDALETEKAEAKAALAREDVGSGSLKDTFQPVAMPAPSANGDETVGYESLVFSQLAKAKGAGQREGVPGSAGVRFEIDAKGQLVSAKIVSPSGDAELDAEALAIVHKAAPFPVPPEGAQRSFSVNVNFTPLGALPAR